MHQSVQAKLFQYDALVMIMLLPISKIGNLVSKQVLVSLSDGYDIDDTLIDQDQRKRGRRINGAVERLICAGLIGTQRGCYKLTQQGIDLAMFLTTMPCSNLHRIFDNYSYGSWNWVIKQEKISGWLTGWEVEYSKEPISSTKIVKDHVRTFKGHKILVRGYKVGS